jgi:hypothetical protein
MDVNQLKLLLPDGGTAFLEHNDGGYWLTVDGRIPADPQDACTYHHLTFSDVQSCFARIVVARMAAMWEASGESHSDTTAAQHDLCPDTLH